MNRRGLILSALTVGVVGFGGAAWFATRPGPIAEPKPVTPALAEALMRPYSPILGPEDAPVTIVEFFDPACEACRAFHPIVKDIMAEHGDAVRVVIRYTPFHGEGSVTAVRVLEAARMQNMFQPVLEALLQEQPRWASHGSIRPDLILGIAAEAGLDANAARTQMMAPQTIGVLNQDVEDVETMGIRQTPTFFVNGKPLDPFGEPELRRLVAAEVSASQS